MLKNILLVVAAIVVLLVILFFVGVFEATEEVGEELDTGADVEAVETD